MNFDSTTRRQLAGVSALAIVLVTANVVASPNTVLEYAERTASNPVLFAGVVAALYLFRPLVAWPMTPVAVVVGYGYGITVGIPVALAGAVVTALPPFTVARYVNNADGPLGRLSSSGESLFETTGSLRGVLAARLAPIPTDVISYAAGLSNVPLRTLVVATAVGELPWTVVAVIAGNSMQTVNTQGVDAVNGPLVAAAAVAAVVLVAGPAYRATRA